MRLLGSGPVPACHICAGQGANKADTCAGDSGGPIVWRRPNQPDLLVGVTSFGPSDACGTSATLNLGAYTSTSAMRSWIKMVIKF